MHLKSKLAQLVEGINTKLAQATRETGTTFSFDPTGKNNDVSGKSIEEKLKLGVLEVTFNPNNLATWAATDTTGEVDGILSGLTHITDPKRLLFEFTKIKVKSVAEKLLPIWKATGGRRGYISVEHDPTIEAQVAEELKATGATPQEIEDECVRRILTEVKELSQIAPNILVKIRASRNGVNPYTGQKDRVGLRVLEEATALKINTNYTIVTTLEQGIEAGHAVKRGKERATKVGITKHIESRISPFLSRIDGYTKAHRNEMPRLDYAYGLAGTINGYQIVHGLYKEFGDDLPQTPIISSVGTKTDDLAPWAYMYVFVGASYVITAPEKELLAYETSPVPVETTILKPLEEILASRFSEVAPNLGERVEKESLSPEMYVKKAIEEWDTLPESEKSLMWKILDEEGDIAFTKPYLNAIETFKEKIRTKPSGDFKSLGAAKAGFPLDIASQAIEEGRYGDAFETLDDFITTGVGEKDVMDRARNMQDRVMQKIIIFPASSIIEGRAIKVGPEQAVVVIAMNEKEYNAIKDIEGINIKVKKGDWVSRYPEIQKHQIVNLNETQRNFIDYQFNGIGLNVLDKKLGNRTTTKAIASGV